MNAITGALRGVQARPSFSLRSNAASVRTKVLST